MSDQKLKPCPCCGSIEDVVEQHYSYEVDDYGNRGMMGVVKCRQCGLLMEARSGLKYAIERWNKRVPVAGLLEACKYAIPILEEIRESDAVRFSEGHAAMFIDPVIKKMNEAIAKAEGDK